MPKQTATTTTHWALGFDETGLGVATLCGCPSDGDHDTDLTSWPCGCPRDGEPDSD